MLLMQRILENALFLVAIFRLYLGANESNLDPKILANHALITQ